MAASCEIDRLHGLLNYTHDGGPVELHAEVGLHGPFRAARPHADSWLLDDQVEKSSLHNQIAQDDADVFGAIGERVQDGSNRAFPTNLANDPSLHAPRLENGRSGSVARSNNDDRRGGDSRGQLLH